MIEKNVKLIKLSPYTKRWWTEELMEAKRKTELMEARRKMQQLGAASKYH